MSFDEQPSMAEGATLDFLEKFTRSARFGELYQEGMSLIEETTAYIDGEGKTQSRSLETSVALAYVAESMRLTTRLMHLASWLFIHKALNDEEIGVSQLDTEREKIAPQIRSRYKPSEHFADLPLGFRSLVKRSLRLNERILALEVQASQANQMTAPRPAIHQAFMKLSAAFPDGN